MNSIERTNKVEEIDRMLDQISNRGMVIIACKMKKPIFVEAHKSAEYKQEFNNLMNRIETSKNEKDRMMRYIFKEGVEPQMKNQIGFIDIKQYIYYTCLVSGVCTDIIKSDWKKWSGIYGYNQFYGIIRDIEAIWEVYKCLEKYFEKVDKMEEFYEGRYIISELKKYTERMINIYREIM